MPGVSLILYSLHLEVKPSTAYDLLCRTLEERQHGEVLADPGW
jgi:hypothetical protein